MQPMVMYIRHADFNNDGYCDLSCIGGGGQVYILYGTGNGGLRYSLSSSYNHQILPSGFYGSEEGCFPVAADADKDGYDDIVWACDDVTGDNQVRAYVIKGQSADFIPPVTVLANITVPSAAFDDHGSITDNQQFKRNTTCSKYGTELCNNVTREQYDKLDNTVFCPSGDIDYGDFDGDGYCDILCHSVGLQIYVKYYIPDIRRLAIAPQSHRKGGLIPPYDTWCHETDTPVVLDINVDGTSDIMCIFPDGKVYITAGTKSHSMTLNNIIGPTWMISLKVSDNVQTTVNPCENVTRNAAYLQADPYTVLDTRLGSFCLNHPASRFLSADIDGNGYCDMICHDNPTSPSSSIYIQYLQDNGRTYETRQHLLYNNHNQCSNGKLYTIDYNADKRFDLICSDGQPLACNKAIDVTYLLSGNTDGINLAGAWTDATVLGAVILGSFACGECPSINERDDVVVSYDEGRYMNKMAKVRCQSKFKAFRGISNPFCRLMWEGGRWRCEDWSKPVQNNWKVYAAKCVPAKPWHKIGISNKATCMKYCKQQSTCWFVTYNYLLHSCSMFSDYGLVSAIDNLPDNSACITFVLD